MFSRYSIHKLCLQGMLYEGYQFELLQSPDTANTKKDTFKAAHPRGYLF